MGFYIEFLLKYKMGDTSTPWKNGYWRALSCPSILHEVVGKNVCVYPASGKPSNLDLSSAKITWKFGDFGEAHPDVAKKLNIYKVRNTVQISQFDGEFKQYAVLSHDRKTLTYYGAANSIDTLEWSSDEEVKKLLESGDPMEAPPNPYKIQPENHGNLLFISGAPGLGKSTTGMLLGKNFGYVYYEADAFLAHLNPYTPTDVEEPTLATFRQNFLKGVSQERIDAVANGMDDFMLFARGKNYNEENLKIFYSAMCKDIAREQKRMGGNFAVAQAVPTRALRDHIRTQLGSNLIFVVLHMSKGDQAARIKARHGDEETFVELLSSVYDKYEPATEDEPNAIHVLITKDMSRDDVVDKIIKMVDNYKHYEP